MKWSKAMLVEGKETLLGVEKHVFFCFTRLFLEFLDVFFCFFRQLIKTFFTLMFLVQ